MDSATFDGCIVISEIRMPINLHLAIVVVTAAHVVDGSSNAPRDDIDLPSLV